MYLPGAPLDQVGELWTRHLHVGPDSVVGGRSAAMLRGLANLGTHLPTLLVRRGSHRRAEGVQIRQVSDLAEEHVTVVCGLPCTTVARTFVELSSEVSPARLEHLLDDATMNRLVTPAELADLIDSLRRSGRSGLGPLVKAVGRRLPGPGVEQGRLERELTSVALLAGVGAGVAQHPHPGKVDSRELVDRAYPDAMMLVEADGRSWHGRYSAMKADRRRDREAARVGWLTVRYTYDDLCNSPEQSAAELRDIYEKRCALLSTQRLGREPVPVAGRSPVTRT